MKRRILWSGSIPAVQQASIDRFEANNPVALFLQETYPEGTPEGTPIQAKNLYAAYTAWRKDTGSKPKSQKWLSEGLDAMGCKKSRSSQNCVVYQIPPMKDFTRQFILDLSIWLRWMSTHSRWSFPELPDDSRTLARTIQLHSRQHPGASG
jgi:phage/plasmid-associated DNA primase